MADFRSPGLGGKGRLPEGVRSRDLDLCSPSGVGLCFSSPGLGRGPQLPTPLCPFALIPVLSIPSWVSEICPLSMAQTPEPFRLLGAGNHRGAEDGGKEGEAVTCHSP